MCCGFRVFLCMSTNVDSCAKDSKLNQGIMGRETYVLVVVLATSSSYLRIKVAIVVRYERYGTIKYDTEWSLKVRYNKSTFF